MKQYLTNHGFWLLSPLIWSKRQLQRFAAACLAIVLLNETLFAQQIDSVISKKNHFHIQLQYAGNMGLGSLGIGKSFFNDNLSFTAIYGYLPKKMNTVAVHTIALKSNIQVLRFSPLPKLRLGLYTGFTLMYGITENTFVKLPSYYPDEYYAPTALHSAFFVGLNHKLIKNNWKWSNLLAVFTEVGTMDYQVYFAIKNKNVDLLDLVNFSAGISLKLAKTKN